uniref:Galactosylgalactosylxylosylprotein 3-beta-glucuronosyltransferase n=2 Tax=Hirondellea gigas TaxID=1518452 RepID=A0A6A7G3L8_9CRUS
MVSILKRLFIQAYYAKRFRLFGCILILLLLFFSWQGWRDLAARSRRELELNELLLKDPSLQLQKINTLKRQVRDLQHKLQAAGVAFFEEPADLPTIYVITPTYARPNQLSELNRLRAVLLHVPRLWWVLVEDREERSAVISNFLASSGLQYTHLAQPTPQEWKQQDNSPRWRRPRGVLQRNAGIAWLRHNCPPYTAAVAYFADDDNSYAIELFDQMRWTQKVSVWPVGLVGGVMLERPVCLCLGDGHPSIVTDWMVGWKASRKFPTDMAGFAVSVALLITKTDAEFSHDSKIGYLETDFLSKLVETKDLEPRANCCTKVLVWHMNAKKPLLKEEMKLRELGRRTDVGIVV